MTQNTEEQVLYDSKLLSELNFSKFKSNFKPPISITDPGTGLVVRSLQSSDYNAGFIELLGQLTITGDVSNEEFIERFHSMLKCPHTYFITVVEDTTVGRVVGSASLVLEKKFIHKCALKNILATLAAVEQVNHPVLRLYSIQAIQRGRVEDVVVSDQYRGKQLGKLLMVTLVLLAEHLGVYKLTLDCRDHMVPFYQSFGYNKEPGNSNYMQIRFKS